MAAMYAMIAGFLTNIIFDYLLVWVLPYGLSGAAAATIIGQGRDHGRLHLLLYQSENRILISQLIRRQNSGNQHFENCPFPFRAHILAQYHFDIDEQVCDALRRRRCCSLLRRHRLYHYDHRVAAAGRWRRLPAFDQPLLWAKGICRSGETKRLAYVTAGVIALGCMILLFAVRHDAAASLRRIRHCSEVAEILPYFIAGFLFLAFCQSHHFWFLRYGEKQLRLYSGLCRAGHAVSAPPGRSKILGASPASGLLRPCLR